MPTVSGSQSIYAGEEWNILGADKIIVFIYDLLCLRDSCFFYFLS